MSDDTGYNGWRNYPTWCVSLWIDNDEGLHCEVRMAAGQARDAYRLALTLQEMVEGLEAHVHPSDSAVGIFGDLTGFHADMFGYAMSQVDWQEIAEGIMAEVKAEA